MLGRLKCWHSNEGSCSFPLGASLLLTLKFDFTQSQLFFPQVEAGWGCCALSPGTLFRAKVDAVSAERIIAQDLCVCEPHP